VWDGTRVQDVLDMLKPLGRERFMTLLTNWQRGVHGKFKVPIFAHQELDLYRVFWSVMDKGGYEIVSANKQWKVGTLPSQRCSQLHLCPPLVLPALTLEHLLKQHKIFHLNCTKLLELHMCW
jgi:hypothetical protein